jgi:hypothetical protein
MEKLSDKRKKIFADIIRKAKMVDGFAQPQDVPVPHVAGYPETGVKTSGVETRGNGAATKGTKARGPLA